MLAPEGVNITDSSNGMDADDNLVLRFTASIAIEPEVFKFENKHMMAITPDGQNVTDSYVQIEGMFEERAEDCSAINTICTSSAAKENEGGTSNSSSTSSNGSNGSNGSSNSSSSNSASNNTTRDSAR